MKPFIISSGIWFAIIVLPFTVFGQSDIEINTTSEKTNTPPPISLDFTYNYFPSRLMTEPVAPGADDLELQIDDWKVELSFLPKAKNKTSRITHTIIYSQFSIDYKNVIPLIEPLVRTAHTIQYSLVWEKVLNDKWDMLTIFNPGLASEFTSSLSKDDLIITLAVLGIRKYKERLAVGYGLGYNPNFGTHYPMPVLALRWNNGRNMKIETIFPVNFSFAYRPNPVFDLGIDYLLEGSSYHGDPDRYQAENPQLRYSVTKIGPNILFHILPWLHLKFSGGITLLRRLEFYDGSNEAGTFDIKQSSFLSMNLFVGSQ